MRRITYWALSTLIVLVLLFSYSTSRGSTVAASSAATRTTSTTASQTTSAAPSPTDLPTATATQEAPAGETGATEAGTAASGAAGSATAGSGAAGSGAATSGTYVGDEVDTRWGIVQVQITVANGKITKSEVVQVPWDNPKDQQINSRAVPVYNQEVVDSQSANIDSIGGATVTWEGYTASVQSAIDQAHL